MASLEDSAKIILTALDSPKFLGLEAFASDLISKEEGPSIIANRIQDSLADDLNTEYETDSAMSLILILLLGLLCLVAVIYKFSGLTLLVKPSHHRIWNISLSSSEDKYRRML